MRLLDRYLLRDMIRTFLVVAMIAGLLLLIGRVFDRMDDILSNKRQLPANEIAAYFLMALPFEMVQVMPLVAMLSVLLSVGGLARNREVVAMVTGGVSMGRIAAPYMGFGLLLGIGLWAAGEFLVPYTQAEAKRLSRALEGKRERDKNTDIVARDADGRMYFVESFVYREHTDSVEGREEMDDFSWWSVDRDAWRLRSRTDAREGFYTGGEPGSFTSWNIRNSVTHSFSGDGVMTERVADEGSANTKLGDNLNLYLRRRQEPEEMTMQELGLFTEVMESMGAKISEYQTMWHMKLAFPLGVVFLVLIGFTRGIMAQRGAYVKGVSQGILFAFLFYLGSAFLRAFGISGVGLPPWVYAWATTAIYAVLGMWLLSRAGRPA